MERNTCTLIYELHALKIVEENDGVRTLPLSMSFSTPLLVNLEHLYNIQTGVSSPLNTLELKIYEKAFYTWLWSLHSLLR